MQQPKKLFFRRHITAKLVCCLMLAAAFLYFSMPTLLSIRYKYWDGLGTWLLLKSNGQSSPKTVLLWTPVFKKYYLPSPESVGCAETRCTITSDRTFLGQSDAVILHARNLRCNDLPSRRSVREDQMVILLNLEAPPQTRRHVKCLSGLVNWTASYRRDSDFYIPHGSYVPLTYTRPPSDRKHFLNKTKMAAWLVSHCNTQSKREDYVKLLKETIPVDIFGRCGKPGCPRSRTSKCNEELASQYYFYLSFENSICKDYVTEKLFNMLKVDIVPVVFGGAVYSSVAPPGSYIDALAFQSPADLGKHLLEVASNQTWYNSFFSWKDQYRLLEPHLLNGWVCDICERLHQNPKSSSVYHDLQNWWTNSECKNWRDVAGKNYAF